MLRIILFLPIVIFFFLLVCVICMCVCVFASVWTQECACELDVMTQPQSLFHIFYWGEVSQPIQSWTIWIISLADFLPDLELQVCQYAHLVLIQTLAIWTVAQSSHSCSNYFRNRGSSLPLLQNIMYFICLGVYLNVCTHAHDMEYIEQLVGLGSLLPCDQYWEQVHWSAEPSFRPDLAFLRQGLSLVWNSASRLSWLIMIPRQPLCLLPTRRPQVCISMPGLRQGAGNGFPHPWCMDWGKCFTGWWQTK